MISFNDEEKEIIDSLLDWYDRQTDLLHPPEWIFSYISKSFAKGCLDINYNKEEVTFKMNVTQDNQNILLKKLSSRVLQIHTVIKTLENFNFIKSKPYRTVRLNLRIDKGDRSTRTMNPMIHIKEELEYIYSIIIPNGVLTQLKKNGFKSDVKLQHEEQIKLLKDQIASDRESSQEQIEILKGQIKSGENSAKTQRNIAFFAIFFALAGPIFTAWSFPTSLENQDNKPLLIDVNPTKIENLNQEVISLKAQVEDLKSEAAKIQALLSKPKPLPAQK